MKFSKFNSIISINSSKYILYNAYTDKFVHFNHDLYSQVNKKEIVNEIDFNPHFYNNLLDVGAIIQDNIDELTLVKEMSDNAINNLSEYILIVNPTTNCNFNCWYCYETHNKKAKISEQTFENIKKLIVNILSEKKELKRFDLSFFGGEPLLYFDKVVKPLMTYVRNECDTRNILYAFSFTTNGYLINKDMLEWFSQFKDINFQITLDGSRELHDKVRFSSAKEGSYDVILSNVKSLLSIHHKITLRINYTTDNIDSVRLIYEDLKDIPKSDRDFCLVDLHRVWQDTDNKDNIDQKVYETISLFSENNFYAKQQLLDNLRKPCYADKVNEALVNYNGDVFCCTARDFETFPRDGYLNSEGVIIWENNSYNRRRNAKFQNEPCLNCRIMPLCCGACSQKALDAQNNKNTYCINGFNEEAKDKVIIDRFYDIFIANK